MIYRIIADSYLEHGRQAVYIDNLATAPWNRSAVAGSPRYSGAGTELLIQAIHHSYLLSYDGRVNLATLPDPAGFYGAHGFRETGAIIEQWPVLEITATDARQKLVDKGIIRHGEDAPRF